MGGAITKLLEELKRALRAMYDARLRGVYLYGSYARGEEDDESDVDVLIVLDRIEHYGAEIERTGRVISDLSLKHAVSISRVFVSEEEWVGSDSSFLANAREEAVPA